MRWENMQDVFVFVSMLCLTLCSAGLLCASVGMVLAELTQRRRDRQLDAEADERKMIEQLKREGRRAEFE